ncbi:MAG TPA: acyltransferase, partial [Nevskiaceae bacterium]|nr:acyltransferase [Nevskiaceae bacterium]
LRDFFVARFARIYPLHFATLMLMVLIELGRWALERHGYATLNSPAFSYATQLRYLPYDITLTHAWGFLPQQTWNVPSWSISAETFCYLAYPLVLRAGVGRGRTATITAWTCSLGALAGLQWWRGGLDLTYDFSPLRCLPEFVIGSLLYQHTRAHHHLLVNRQWKREALPVAACLLVLLSMWMQTTDIVVVTALAMMVITCADNRSRLARVLSLKPLHYLGDISYSVYLLHHLVLVLFIVVLMVNQGSVADFLLEHSTVTIMLACLTAVVLAHFSYQRLERPAQRWLRRWLGRRRAPEPAAAPASG